MNNKGNVIHINHTTFGGPGRVANTIYDALEKEGYINYFVTVRGNNSDKRVIYLNKTHYWISRILSKIFNKLSTSPVKIEPEVYCFPKHEEILKKVGTNKIDIIILYWYKNTVSIRDIKKLVELTSAKVFVYLMDEGPITGGCHYYGNCHNYISGCGNCPSLFFGKINKGITYLNVKKDRDVFEQINAKVIAPTTLSRIASDESYKLANLEKEKLLIPLSNNYTKVKSKKEYRRFLNLDKDGLFLFFGASKMNEPRKGMKYLVESLKILYTKLHKEELEKITLLIAGNSGYDFNTLNFKIVNLGYLDYTSLINTYHASDLFISPSIIDMGPMMVNESIKCGLPVVCFNVGVSNDIVINDKTGFRVETENIEAMADAILKFIRLSTQERDEMSINCEKLGEEILSVSSFNRKIKEIFGTI